MIFSRLVPSVFYVDISDGLNLFVHCLQFSIKHQELTISNPYCVLEKDGVRPWGAKEFAIADKQVGIRFQQW